MVAAERGDLVRSVSRALALLRCFSPGQQSLSLQELSERAGIPKSTAVRLLETLIAEGMIIRNDPGRTYSPGFGLVYWTQLAYTRWGVPREATGEMRRVARETGESVSLYVRVGDNRVALEHVPGSQSLRHVITPGEPMTLSAGATSWILLQEAGPDLLERVERALRERRAPRTARELIADSRRSNFAYSVGERELGVAGVSVRVNGRGGELLAALTVGGPSTRITQDRLGDMVDLLHKAAALIGQALDAARSETD